MNATILPTDVFIEYLGHQRLIVDLFYTAAAALAIYDYLITLHLEITLVWFRPWKFTKIVFLLVRYMPFVYMWFSLHNQLLPDVIQADCGWSYAVLLWVMSFGIIFTTVVLMVRTWAVWRRDRMILYLFIALLVGGVIQTCICNVKFMRAIKFGESPYPGFRGCFVTEASSIARGDFIASAILELVVLALMSISAYKTSKSGSQSELLQALHRDGVLFYVHLFGSTIFNVILMIVMPLDLQLVLVPMSGVLYSSLTCRVIFNLRTIAKRGRGVMATELQEIDEEPAMGPLTFLPGPDHDNFMLESVRSVH